jgi:hypothetical protein
MHWKWRVRHAQGFRELGLLKEAAEELAAVPTEHTEETEFLREKAILAQEREEWAELAAAARILAHREPHEPDWWILWAFGTRRSVSIEAAEKILLVAVMMHDRVATIHFNLGCYACLLGNLDGARARVARAIGIDSQFQDLARTDPDLEALRQSNPELWM